MGIYNENSPLLGTIGIINQNQPENQLNNKDTLFQKFKDITQGHTQLLNPGVLTLDKSSLAPGPFLNHLHQQIESILKQTQTVADYQNIMKFCELLANTCHIQEPDFETLYFQARILKEKAENRWSPPASSGWGDWLSARFQQGFFKNDRDLLDLLREWAIEKPRNNKIYGYIQKYVMDKEKINDLHQWSHQDGLIKKKEYLDRLFFQIDNLDIESYNYDELQPISFVCVQLFEATKEARWNSLIGRIKNTIDQRTSERTDEYIDDSATRTHLTRLNNPDSSEAKSSWDKFLTFMEKTPHDSFIDNVRASCQIYYQINSLLQPPYDPSPTSDTAKALKTILNIPDNPKKMAFTHLYVRASLQSKEGIETDDQPDNPMLFSNNGDCLSFLNEDIAFNDLSELYLLLAKTDKGIAKSALLDGYLDPDQAIDRLVSQIPQALQTDSVQNDTNLKHNIKKIISLTDNAGGLRDLVSPQIDIADPVAAEPPASYRQLLTDINTLKTTIQGIPKHPSSIQLNKWVQSYQKVQFNPPLRPFEVSFSHIYEELFPDDDCTTKTMNYFMTTQRLHQIHWQGRHSEKSGPILESAYTEIDKVSNSINLIQSYYAALSSRWTQLVKHTKVPVSFGESIWLFPGFKITGSFLRSILMLVHGHTMKGTKPSGIMADVKTWIPQILDNILTLRHIIDLKKLKEIPAFKSVSETIEAFKNMSDKFNSILFDREVSVADGEGNIERQLKPGLQSQIYALIEIVSLISSKQASQLLADETIREKLRELNKSTDMQAGCQELHDSIYRVKTALFDPTKGLLHSKVMPDVLHDSSITNLLRALKIEYSPPEELAHAEDQPETEEPVFPSDKFDYNAAVKNANAAVKNANAAVKNALEDIPMLSQIIKNMLSSIGSLLQVINTTDSLRKSSLINIDIVTHLVRNLDKDFEQVRMTLQERINNKEFDSFLGFMKMMYIYHYPSTDSVILKIFVTTPLLILKVLSIYFIRKDWRLFKSAKAPVVQLCTTYSKIQAICHRNFNLSTISGKSKEIIDKLIKVCAPVDPNVTLEKRIESLLEVINMVKDTTTHCEELGRNQVWKDLNTELSGFLSALVKSYNNPILLRLGQNHIYKKGFIPKLNRTLQEQQTDDQAADPPTSRSSLLSTVQAAVITERLSQSRAIETHRTTQPSDPHSGPAP